MILEVIRALLLGAMPVALFTFAILQWSIASGRMKKFTDGENLERQYKKHVKASKKQADKMRRDVVGDFMHSKIMSFGGGFYGTMAVLTYAVIEIVEIWRFLLGLIEPQTWIDKLGFDLLLEFFINSLTNLVAAFVWFGTLPEYITINNGFVWLAAAYAGYLGGLRLTSERGDEIWERVRSILKLAK